MTSDIKKNEKLSRKVRALPVYSINEGVFLGSVRLLLIDPAAKQVVALLLERRRLAKEERILPFSAIISIGDDAITIQNSTDIQKKSAFVQYTRLLRQPIQPIGARCFTAGGNTLGRIDEYRFDCTSGKICGLEITADGLFKEKILINGSHIMAMSSHTVMLSDKCLDDYQVIDNSLLSSMETAKDKATAAARGTFEASKKISQNISSKLKNIEEIQLEVVAEEPSEEPLLMENMENESENEIENETKSGIDNNQEITEANENDQAIQNTIEIEVKFVPDKKTEPNDQINATYDDQSINDQAIDDQAIDAQAIDDQAMVPDDEYDEYDEPIRT